MTRILGIGGATQPGSTTEKALRITLQGASEAGAQVRLVDGAWLSALPHYGAGEPCEASRALIAAVREADGLVIASPAYHGSVSGLVKNALDHLQETASDPRPYIDGVAVGLVATAYGGQAGATTMVALRSIVHSLRGWPTPYGACIQGRKGLFDDDGGCADAEIEAQLRLVGAQVAEFARRTAAAA